MPDPVDFIVTAILDVDRESSPERTRRGEEAFRFVHPAGVQR